MTASHKDDLYLSYAFNPTSMGYRKVSVHRGEGDEAETIFLSESFFGEVSRHEMTDIFVRNIKHQRPKRVFVRVPGSDEPLQISKEMVDEIIAGRSGDLYIGKE